MCPNVLDNKVFARGMRDYTNTPKIDVDGNECVDVMVRFKTLEDCEAVYDVVHQSDIFKDCNGPPGSSYYQIHKCFIDETPHKSCIPLAETRVEST